MFDAAKGYPMGTIILRVANPVHRGVHSAWRGRSGMRVADRRA